MFTLIAMGTGIAWLFSLVATLAPGIFPTSFRSDDGTVDVYFEAAAVITTLVLLGQCSNCGPASKPPGRSGTARPQPQDGPSHHRQRRRRRDPLDAVQRGDRLRVRQAKPSLPMDRHRWPFRRR